MDKRDVCYEKGKNVFSFGLLCFSVNVLAADIEAAVVKKIAESSTSLAIDRLV